MPAAALIVHRREPLRDSLTTARPIAEDIYRDPVAIAPHKAPEPIPRPIQTRIARNSVRAYVGGMPEWQEPRFLGRLFQPPPNARQPRGVMQDFEESTNIYLPPSTAYGSQMEIG